MNLHSFDLNLLRILDALLREESATLAGHRIGLSQPAVSAGLGRLRGALNDPLFVRQGQKLRPTSYAKSLEMPLRNILDLLEGLLAGPETFNPLESRDVFRLSGSDFFAELLMPKLAGYLEKAAPGVRVQQVDLVPDNYINSLERYEVDFALMPQAQVPEWVDAQPVFHSGFVVVARSTNRRLACHGIKPGETIPIDLYCDMGHVLFSPEGKLKGMGDAALAKVGRERNIAMTMPFFSGVSRVVAVSDHIALLPQRLAEHLAPILDLDIYQAPVPSPKPLLCVFWHKRSSHDPAHRWMRSVIADLLLPFNDGEPPLPGKQGKS